MVQIERKYFGSRIHFTPYLAKSSTFCFAGALTVKITCSFRMLKITITTFQHTGQAWNRQIRTLRFRTDALYFAPGICWNSFNLLKILNMPGNEAVQKRPGYECNAIYAAYVMLIMPLFISLRRSGCLTKRHNMLYFKYLWNFSVDRGLR